MAIVDSEVPFLAAATDTALAGVSDFRGRLVYRSTSGGWRSALFVIVVEIASTFAYFGLSANLITYMTGPLGHSNAAAAAAVNVWSGTASLMPLLGAFVADSWLGRYRSIILGCILYVMGYGMITIVSTLPALHLSPQDDNGLPSMLVAFFYTSLYLIAIARGIDKPCGVAFAADQFDPDHPRERVTRSSLFNWWYFSIAIGMAAAIAMISYIQENVGWGIGFGMLCGIMLCSFFVFLLGSPTYRIYAPTPGNESPFTRLGCGLVALAKSSSFPFGAREDDLREEEDEAAVTRSEEARTVLRLLLIWAACLAYGVVFAQIMTFFNKQGRTLDRRIFGGLVLPPASCCRRPRCKRSRR
uniref:Uncharacterized protein n=1 Tax=Avena sativa TaxID=4498 RepID=A0ACD5WPK9_AVESA